VPKTPVHENGNALAAEYEVGLSENGRIASPAGDAVFAHERDEAEFRVLFPRERMSAITALRFTLVKTSVLCRISQTIQLAMESP
jgi:hypothetical protein